MKQLRLIEPPSSSVRDGACGGANATLGRNMFATCSQAQFDVAGSAKASRLI